ncbi:O-antigen ligase family protein [Microbacterium sp. NPDC091382]|uniref:O-antigen ligase family protein n=1 Tax=Microbacterium sp. NPDC091382 TaxID=3364210 RepID=UPI00380747D1
MTLAGLGLALTFLGIARSALVPEALAFATPLIALALIAATAMPSARSLRVGASALPVVAVSFLLICSTAARGNSVDWIKSIGIGLLWIFAFVVCANLSRRSSRTFLKMVIWFGLIQLPIMVFESLIPIAGVRNAIAATSSEGYLIRSNLILGDWTNRAQGTLGYPIAAGNLMALCFALVLFVPRIRPTTRVVGAALFAGGVLMTGTRSGLIAIAIACVVGGWLYMRGLARVWALVGTAIAAVAVTSFLTSASSSGDFSFEHRFGVVQSFGALLERPWSEVLFGSGLNSHEAAFRDGYIGASSTWAIDNAYLTIFIASGVVALATLIAVLARGLLSGDQYLRPAIAVFAVFFLSYDALWWHLSAFLFWAVMGMASRADPVDRS